MLALLTDAQPHRRLPHALPVLIHTEWWREHSLASTRRSLQEGAAARWSPRCVSTPTPSKGATMSRHHPPLDPARPRTTIRMGASHNDITVQLAGQTHTVDLPSDRVRFVDGPKGIKVHETLKDDHKLGLIADWLCQMHDILPVGLMVAAPSKKPKKLRRVKGPVVDVTDQYEHVQGRFS